MTSKTQLHIFEYLSYILIIGATVIFFAMRSQGLSLTLVVLVLAIGCRWMMERTRWKACEEENEQLRQDLRRLTQVLAQSKKQGHTTEN